MGEKLKTSKHKDTKPRRKESGLEWGGRIGRDFNIFVGSVALVGAVIAPPLAAAPLGIYAGINFAQAGGFEYLRRRARKKHQKNLESKKRS